MCAAVCVRFKRVNVFWAKLKREREKGSFHDDVSRHTSSTLLSAQCIQCNMHIECVESLSLCLNKTLKILIFKRDCSTVPNMSHGNNYNNNKFCDNETKQSELNHIACHLIEYVYLFTRLCRLCVWVSKWAHAHRTWPFVHSSIRAASLCFSNSGVPVVWNYSYLEFYCWP